MLLLLLLLLYLTEYRLLQSPQIKLELLLVVLWLSISGASGATLFAEKEKKKEKKLCFRGHEPCLTETPLHF